MSAVFECKVKHDPTLDPTVTWLKDNRELPDGRYDDSSDIQLRIQLHHGTKTRIVSFLCNYAVIRFEVNMESLTIKNVTEEDEGTYTCIMNTTLDQDSASAMLTVVGPFKVHLSDGLPNAPKDNVVYSRQGRCNIGLFSLLS